MKNVEKQKVLIKQMTENLQKHKKEKAEKQAKVIHEAEVASEKLIAEKRLQGNKQVGSAVPQKMEAKPATVNKIQSLVTADTSKKANKKNGMKTQTLSAN